VSSYEFISNTTTILTDQKELLDNLVERLQEYPDVRNDWKN